MKYILRRKLCIFVVYIKNEKLRLSKAKLKKLIYTTDIHAVILEFENRIQGISAIKNAKKRDK